MRRSGLAVSFRSFCAFLLTSVAFLGAAREAGAESVRARVRLFGACADTGALAAELARRGVLLEVLAPDAGAAPFVVAVSVDVASNGRHQAALSVLDADGARDDRALDARDCGELRAAVAWVLVSLVREREAQRAAPPTQPPVAAFPDAPASPPRPSPAAAVDTPVRDGGAVSVSPQPEPPRAFRVGTAFSLGFGMTDQVALGAVVSAEYATLPFLGVRLSAWSLSASDIRAEEAVVSIDRRAAQLSVVLRLDGVPLWLAGGVEAGLLSAGARGLAEQGEDEAGWVSLPISAGATVPLFAEVLELHVAGGAAWAPYPYRLRASGETLMSPSTLEIRTEFGLTGRL
jgi:hypothetical protein